MIDILPQQKSLPYSEESERAVLGGILLDPTVLPSVSGVLRVDDFYVERHQVLYRVMLSLQEQQIEIDLRTVQAKLEQQGRFDAAGGISYLATLDLDLPDIGRIDAYSEIVKERSVRRQLIQSSGQTIRESLDGGLPAGEVLGRAIDSLSAIQHGSARGGWIEMNDLQDLVANKLDNDGYAHSSLPTGLPDLDSLIDGLPAGDLTFVAARPGCGKSALLSQIVEHNACRVDQRERVPCGFVTLEMTNEKLLLRMISRRTGIPYKRLLRGGFNGGEWSAINAAQGAIRNSPIWFEETVLGVSEVVAAAKKLRRKHGIRLLAIDYLGLMSTSDVTKESRTLQIGEISRRLAGFAKAERVDTLIAYQLNRVSAERNTRPDLHHLAESGAGERDGNLIIMIWQELDTRGIMTGNSEILVRKHRDGETGVVETLFNGPRMLFTCKENNRRYP